MDSRPPEPEGHLTPAGAEILGPAAEEGLTLQAARGVAWTGAFQLLAQPLTLVVGVVLARLLTPSDFGVMGMAGIVLGLMALINEFGLASAVIQKKELSDRELSSLFWFNLAFGAVLTVVGLVIARPVAAYFKSDILWPVLSVLSIGFTTSSIAAIHSALLNRRMEFRALAMYTFYAVVVNSVIAIGLALAGAGVWSLALSGLLSGLVSAVLIWRRAHWTPTRVFDWSACISLVKFGANVTGSSVLNYATSNVDYLVVGRVLGPMTLGIYTLAYNIMMFPLRKVSGVLVAATYPAFARIQDDDARFSSAYLRATRLLGIATIPLLAAMIVVAPELIVGLYGQKWAAAAIPLQILGIAGMQKAVGTLVGVVFRGKGRPDIEVRLSALSLVLLVVGVLVGVSHGSAGVAVAVVVVSLSTGVLVQWSAGRLVGHGLREVALTLVPGVAMGVVSALVTLAAKTLLVNHIPDILTAGVSGMVGVAAALLVGWIGWRDSIEDVIGIVRDMLERRKNRRRAEAVGD